MFLNEHGIHKSIRKMNLLFSNLVIICFYKCGKSLHPLGLLGLHTEVIIQIIEKKLSALVHAELEQRRNC